MSDVIVTKDQIDLAERQLIQLIDLVWNFVVLVMIFNMQMGFTLYEVGAARRKHSRSVLFKNLVDTLVCVLGFWLVGYRLSTHAQGGFMGTILTSFKEENYFIKWLISFSFCNTSSTIVSGCLAERMHNESYLVFSLLMATLIYPVSCAWVWGGGWLSLLDFHDYAGSGVVHLVGGVAGLVFTLQLGPRLGFAKGFKNTKFKYGENTVSKELVELESMNFRRKRRIKDYKRTRALLNELERTQVAVQTLKPKTVDPFVAADKEIFKSKTVDPFLAADFDSTRVPYNKDRRKSSVPFLDNNLIAKLGLLK